MFVTTLVFAKLVTWMRGQSGTSDLRALAYMDEVAGYVPPTAAPPAKKPILTILKQGRAFGLGLVLSTQNPVDLDYKAMSNAGTWLVGRLQTENDKARVLEGLRSAAGGADISALDSSIGALQKRQFMLVSAKDSRPRVFSTRWAMSYLRGPLTKEQVQQLMSAAPRPAEAAPAAAAGAAPRRASPHPAAPLAADETSVAPAVAAGATVSYLDPAAPWAAQVGATAGVTRLHAFVATRVSLRYDDTAAGHRRAAGVRGALRAARRRPRPRCRDGGRLRRPRLPPRRTCRRHLRPAGGADRRGEVLRPGRQGRAGAARREPGARDLPQQAAQADLPPGRDARRHSSHAATRPVRRRQTRRR